MKAVRLIKIYWTALYENVTSSLAHNMFINMPSTTTVLFWQLFWNPHGMALCSCDQSISGIFKPEDPRITEESRALWLRSYMEEKWRLLGRDPDNIPDVAMEKFELEMKRSEIVSNKKLNTLRQIYNGRHFDCWLHFNIIFFLLCFSFWFKLLTLSFWPQRLCKKGSLKPRQLRCIMIHVGQFPTESWEISPTRLDQLDQFYEVLFILLRNGIHLYDRRSASNLATLVEANLRLSILTPLTLPPKPTITMRS